MHVPQSDLKSPQDLCVAKSPSILAHSLLDAEFLEFTLFIYFSSETLLGLLHPSRMGFSPLLQLTEIQVLPPPGKLQAGSLFKYTSSLDLP